LWINQHLFAFSALILLVIDFAVGASFTLSFALIQLWRFKSVFENPSAQPSIRGLQTRLPFETARVN
jgi:hypothetical protein